MLPLFCHIQRVAFTEYLHFYLQYGKKINSRAAFTARLSFDQ